jgi:citrate lyase beta subunit
MKDKVSLKPAALGSTLAKLKKANAAFLKITPGDSADRQPVHTVYGGAQLFKADTAKKLGEKALKALEANAPDAATFADALGLDEPLGQVVYERVQEKLAREAVEDFRIDFEDGYGNRPDAEEDADAERTALEVAKGMKEGTLPPFIGIRIKTFSPELHLRSLRTLDIFVTTLARAAKKLPEPFFVTLPKITAVEQVSTLADVLTKLEKANKLKAGSIKIELMVETPQSIFGVDGSVTLRSFAAAAGGRCTGAHFGTYDYTASQNITAAHQRMDHPACDFAKHVMQVALSGTGVMLSDGATNVMPVGDRETVHRAWKLHFDHVRHSLVGGFYQGWDLHPAQLATRYAAVFSFFLEGLAPASARLKNFIEKAAQATLVGDVFDDAATGQGLLNYFLRGINSGAFTEKDAEAAGLTHEELQGRSFLKILQNRKALAK